MRVFIGMVLLLVTMASGVWAYLQNHKANMAEAHIETLERDIAQLQKDIGVFKIEWANLNRPSRLRAMVDEHFERLQLVEMTGFSFGTSAALPTLPTDDGFGGLSDVQTVANSGTRP